MVFFLLLGMLSVIGFLVSGDIVAALISTLFFSTMLYLTIPLVLTGYPPKSKLSALVFGSEVNKD